MKVCLYRVGRNLNGESMLIRTQKHSTHDLEAWRRVERLSELHRQLKIYARHVGEAERELLSFAARGHCYVGVSWGKDSVAVADIAMRMVPKLPLVWIRVEPIKNPECALVRDNFLRQWPRARYEEIEVWCRHDASGWHATGTLERGFSRAVALFGANHISGVRAQESGARKRRMMHFGLSTQHTCAPLGRWSSDDIWAYLHMRGLPIHPAYGYLLDGHLDPGRVRVASLTGQRGTGWGRAHWEERYYPDVLREIANREITHD
jgi:3'-phosphoadenosine 5'-phosphosulfate sulfotransferase (PAPS reductase)/FAD synthetase